MVADLISIYSCKYVRRRFLDVAVCYIMTTSLCTPPSTKLDLVVLSRLVSSGGFSLATPRVHISLRISAPFPWAPRTRIFVDDLSPRDLIMGRRQGSSATKLARANFNRVFVFWAFVGTMQKCSAFCWLGAATGPVLRTMHGAMAGGGGYAFARNLAVGTAVLPAALQQQRQQKTGRSRSRHCALEMKAKASGASRSKATVMAPGRKRKLNPRRGGPSTLSEGYSAEAFGE